MKKEIKNPRGMTVEFRLEVANALRDFCSKTDIPLTRVVNNAVEAYMPKLQKIMEAMNGVDAEDSEQKSEERCPAMETFQTEKEMRHDSL